MSPTRSGATSRSQRQMAMAPRILARQAPGAGRLSLDAYLAQLGLAHAQVMAGVKEQNKPPARLTALAFEAPEVSIVIPAHDKFWVTYNCLAALLLSPNEATFEIIVVDDGSSDLTVELPENRQEYRLCPKREPARLRQELQQRRRGRARPLCRHAQ